MTNYSTLAQLYYDGAYRTLPSLVDAATGVTLERGVTDDLDLKTGTCTFRLNDDTDMYRPSNAASSIYGQTGQYMRGAFATSLSVRFTGETDYMNPGQTDDHRESGGVSVRGRRWVDVKLGGPLMRVGRWRDPLASPLFTSITGQYAANLRGYFPLEDGRDSTSLANVSHPSKTGRFNGVTLGAAGPGGAGTALEMSATGSFTTPYASMSTTAGWQLAFAVKTGTGVDASSRSLWEWRTTNGYRWYWRVNTTNYNLLIRDPDGATVLDELYSHVGTDAGPGPWVYTRIKVRIVSGNVQIEPSWFSEAADTFWGVTTSYAGTNMGAPTQSTVPGGPATDGGRFSHHFVVTGVADNLESDDFTDAFIGYRRETAGARFARLCTSRGLSYVIRGTSSITAEMGTQQLTTFQDQLKSIRVSEGGLIFDRGDNIGIVLATRDYLYSQAAAPVLDVTTAQLSGTVQEVTSAVDLYNLVTAENVNGSSATAELATGRYGTQNPPTGAGRLDKTVTVNLASDGPLGDVANWWLRFWTQAGPRFDTITIDLDNQPGLTTACNTAEPGMFIRLTGRTPDPLLLLILTTAQRTNRKRNIFTFGVAAGSIFNVGVYDDAGSRYDSSSTTLAAGATSTATSLSLTTTNYHDRWSTTSLPYALMVAGERVTATAMTAAVYSSGVWTQTATVTRSVNGVIKAQSSGAVVQLADPVYYG
jgi:hypothetical protein